MKMSVEEEDKGIGDAPSEEGVDDGGERLRMEDFVVVKDASEMDRGDGKPENGLIRTGTAAALANLHLINPFVHTLDPGTVVDLIQVGRTTAGQLGDCDRDLGNLNRILSAIMYKQNASPLVNHFSSAKFVSSREQGRSYDR